MDPYLEHPILWPGFHHQLISTIRVALNEQLPDDFVANVDERVYVIQPEREIIPDVAIVRERAPAGSTVTLPERAAPWLLTIYPLEIREGYIEIRRVGAEGEVVTVIEVLSPSNKAAGTEGRRLYLNKQLELLESRTNLVEIDLLRGGRHTVAPPRSALEARGNWDHLIVVHRAAERFGYAVWPNLLREPLPAVDIPLDEAHADTTLMLQAAFEAAYSGGRYDRLLKQGYAGPAPVALNEEDSAWAEALLRKAGLRPGTSDAA